VYAVQQQLQRYASVGLVLLGVHSRKRSGSLGEDGKLRMREAVVALLVTWHWLGLPVPAEIEHDLELRC